MLVGIVMLSIIVSLVSANATCTRNADGACISCTHTAWGCRTLIGYNYVDSRHVDLRYVDVFGRRHTLEFANPDEARRKLRQWGYRPTSECWTMIGRPTTHDFTRAGWCDSMRYQAVVDNSWKYIRLNQGPEPSPCACSGLYCIDRWHAHCFNDCERAGFCRANNGVD